jgi:nitrate/TMAO reductase-like tetraheme cytochrome c subunit
MRPFKSNICRRGLWAVALSITAFAAHSEGDRQALRQPLLPKYQQECTGCHIAFPAGLLPAESWQRLMSGLPRHFGTDASLEAASAKEISNWLAANAGKSRREREAPPEDRITRSAWFVREHGEVSAAVWKRPSVKSPANCSACHQKAETGNFSEHDIRIPR